MVVGASERWLGLRVLAWAAIVASLAVAPRARAQAQEGAAPPDSSQDDEARSLFVAGQTAFDAGRYEAALAHFRSAFELSGRPQLLYNIGLAADRLRQDQAALTAFEGFVARVPNSPLRPVVEARVAILREAIAQQISPEEVAAAEQAAERRGADDALARRQDDGSVVKTWWFWTLVGVVVAGAATGVLVVATRDNHQAPIAGDEGVVIRALSSR